MNKLISFLFIILIFCSCDYRSWSGVIVTEKRNVGSFTGVSVSGGFEVEIRKGAPGITLEADDNIVSGIETSIVGGQLKIKYEKHVNLHDVVMKVYITAPELNQVHASASADIVVKDKLSSGKLNISSSSGASITATVDAPEISARSSSGAELILNGRTKNLEADASSGASIRAKELLSEYTNASTSSGATAHVHASVKLSGSASSGGNISYHGGGSVSKKESSGGSVDAE